MSENQIDCEAIAASLGKPRAFGAIFGLRKQPARYTFILSCCAIVLLATLAAPAGAAAAAKWTLRQLPPTIDEGHEYRPTLSGVSCPSESLCVAGGGVPTGGMPETAAAVVFSQAPTGGLAEWHVVTLPPAPGGVAEKGENFGLSAISCASQSLCVAVGSIGDSNKGMIVVSTEPTGAAAAWSPTVIKEGHGLVEVSCPSASLCAAVAGKSGKVFTSTEPTSGNWQATQLAGSPNLRGISCGTPSLCVAVGYEGRIFVSTNPTGGASAWQEAGTPGGPGALQGVSCVSTLLCAAGNLTGNVLTSTDPSAGSAGTWSEANAGTWMRITGLSCPTASRCVGVDDNGDVLTSTDPSGGTGSWQVENLVPFIRPPIKIESPENGLFAASCASTSLCALVGTDGRIFTSTEPFSASTEPSAEPPAGPRTVLLLESYPLRTRHRLFRVRFRFYSHSRVTGFECKRDRGPYRSCHSPLRYWVASGRRHVLQVRAIGPTGLRGPAAIDRFRVDRFRGVHPSGNGRPTAHTSVEPAPAARRGVALRSIETSRLPW